MNNATTRTITFNPKIRGGKPTMCSTRLALEDVLCYLQAGMSSSEIIENFPSLNREDVFGCVKYAINHPELPIAQNISVILQHLANEWRYEDEIDLDQTGDRDTK